MTRKTIAGLLLFCTGAFYTGAYTGVAAASDDLTRFFTVVKSYSARFHQIVLDSDGRETQRSAGYLYIERPDKFRWEYDAPYEQHIVGDGNKVWVYDIGLEQVTVRPMSVALGDTPAALLAGKGELNQNFTVQDMARSRAGAKDWIRLKPKNKESGFDEIRLAFEHERLAVVELVDGFGQTTRILLSDYKENIKLDPAKFKFTPPAGVDVLEQ